MIKLGQAKGTRLAALALAAAGVVALSACEERAYPSAAPSEGTAAPPQDEALAGAPQGYAPPPAPRSPEYVAPPPASPAPPRPYGYAQDGYGPGRYPPPPAAYPPGYGHQSATGAPPAIVSMAPIPNPPEPERHARVHRRHMQGYGPAYPWRPHRHHRHRVWGGAPAYAPPYDARRHHRHGAAVPASAPARQSQAYPGPTAQLVKPVAPSHHRHHRLAPPSAATAAAAGGGPTSAMDPASEADRYQALQKSLRDDFASVGRLDAPARMEPNQPADVTLTLPAEFAQDVQSEAGKQGLAPAFATVNLTSTLTGNGYAVTPADPETLPLAYGQPTVFHWKVTTTGAGRGALTASLKLAPAGSDHALDLGAKSSGANANTGRVVGIGLLALIALALLGWAAQRRRPAPTGAVKPRPAAYNQPNP